MADGKEFEGRWDSLRRCFVREEIAQEYLAAARHRGADAARAIAQATSHHRGVCDCEDPMGGYQCELHCTCRCHALEAKLDKARAEIERLAVRVAELEKERDQAVARANLYFRRVSPA